MRFSRKARRAIAIAVAHPALPGFRRVATRYDRLATNYHAALCLAATVSYWLWVRTLSG